MLRNVEGEGTSMVWWVDLGYPPFEEGKDGFPRTGQVVKHYRENKMNDTGNAWTQIKEERPLLSPPVSFVAQKLVDVIRQVLSCHRVNLLAYGSAGHLYYVAGSGFTAEQEQYWREVGGHFHPLEFVDETVHERFSAGHSVILTADSLHRSLPFPSALGSENILAIPLFLAQRLAGGSSSSRQVRAVGMCRRRWS
jgi:hypothetical protein